MSLLTEFIDTTLDPEKFGHREHVMVAYELLQHREFLDACTIYFRSIQAIAQKAGAEDKANLTITIVFLSVIAERMEVSIGDDFSSFLETNADLLDPGLIHQWYSKAQLTSHAARTRFVMPART